MSCDDLDLDENGDVTTANKLRHQIQYTLQLLQNKNHFIRRDCFMECLQLINSRFQRYKAVFAGCGGCSIVEPLG